MGENEIWLDARDVRALRVACDHCKSELVFDADDQVGPPAELRCPNCNMLMAGALPLLQTYRKFIAALAATSRGARFRATVR